MVLEECCLFGERMTASPYYHKVILVTRKTMLEELVERHGTRDQAEFLTVHRGQSFRDIQEVHSLSCRTGRTQNSGSTNGATANHRAFISTKLFILS